MIDIVGLFIGRARAAPERPAAKDPTRDLTYAQLEREVRDLAAGLEGRGVGEGDRVAIHLPNSVDFLVVALACGWVGAAFVPLAVTDPEARLSVILDDCGPALVVTSEAESDAAPLPDGLVRHRPVTISAVKVAEGRPHPHEGEADRPAYAIYTSGTTGTPKGVLIGTAAFVAAVRSTIDALGLDADTRTLCVSPFHFDGSFATLFPTVAAGGSVVILPRESLLFARTFFNAVTREEITYTGFSPSYLRILLADPKRSKLAGTSLRIIALGGEASSPADVASLWEVAPDIRVFNRYGPTETTIAVTHIELDADMIGRHHIPIGTPHPGVTFHLVDDEGRLVTEVGPTGELYVGGAQLMSGYWRAPELTAGVLRTDVVPGRTVYRTGDLVARDEAGNYVYVDRADRVIKRSGVRISLIEVGETLRRVGGVSAATAAAFDDDGRLGIVAFVVSASIGPVDVKRRATTLLPDTMVPDRILIVDELPITASSKVDERRLLAGAGLRPPPKGGT